MALQEGLISSVFSLGAKLLHSFQSSVFSPSSSSNSHNVSVEDDLRQLMKTFRRIKATLNDAEAWDIQDNSSQLWLTGLRWISSRAEDLLDEYNYEVLRARVAISPKGASSSSPTVSFPERMEDRIQELISRFREIVEDRKALRLRNEDGVRRHVSGYNRETTHLVDNSCVFGRVKEKADVIDLLVSNHGKRRVVSIVGKGGLGKTTLAQLIYDDPTFRQQFDIFGWLSVTEDFNVCRLTRVMIESFTRTSCGLTDLSALQDTLKDAVRGQRLFVVLDDVWNEEHDLWELLQAPFSWAETETILITTRNERVARIMQTVSPFRLECLPEDECWLLFQHYAFAESDHGLQSNIVEIGKQIVTKCGGLPLAVKSLARHLRLKSDEDDWRDILDSDLWESDANGKIINALKISYAHLPVHLKPCFLLCSMFPKGHCFEKNNFIRLWIAHGYVEPEGGKTVEEIGGEYFEELIQRSVFDHDQEYYSSEWEYNSMFKVHDVIHELAQTIVQKEHSLKGDYNFRFLDDRYEISHRYERHYDGLIPVQQVSTLRTLILDLNNEENLDISDVAQAQTLRALELRWGGPRVELPDSIGYLKHLRYLYLSFCGFSRLPESICFLYNLQMLTIFECPNLVEFPSCIENLISMQYLNLTVPIISPRLLESVSLLLSLRTLILSSASITEIPETLGELIELRRLVLSNCKIKKLPESIIQLKNLHTLCLYFCRFITELPIGIAKLTKLRNLILRGSGVIYMPVWIEKLGSLQRFNASLRVRTDNGHDSIGLLKDLANIKGNLHMFGLQNMVSIYDAKNANLKTKCHIKKLTLCWSDWAPVAQGIDEFTFSIGLEGIKGRLAGRHLEILEYLQPHRNLKEISIIGYNGEKFPNWIRDPLLCALLDSVYMESCISIRSLSFGDLRSLKRLHIAGCHELESLPLGSLPYNLQFLWINNCRELVSLAGLHNHEKLVLLSVENCMKLQFSHSQPLPSKIVSLCVDRCPQLKSLPGIQNLGFLRELKLTRCNQLYLSRDEMLKAVPHIEIFECPRMQQWCLRQHVLYTESSYNHNLLNARLGYEVYDSY